MDKKRLVKGLVGAFLFVGFLVLMNRIHQIEQKLEPDVTEPSEDKPN